MTPPAAGIVARQVPGDFGATEIDGLDPNRDLHDPAVGRWLRDLLWQHAVVCVRLPDKLTDAQLRVVVSLVGAIKDPIGIDRDGNAVRYSDERQVIDAGFVLTDELRASLGDVTVGGDDVRPGLFQFFHTDDSYVDHPASATVLHARQLPDGGGGDTCFLDMRAALGLLDADTTATDHRLDARSTPTTTTAPFLRDRPLQVSSSGSSRWRIRSCARIPSLVDRRSTSISIGRRTSTVSPSTKDARCSSRCRIMRNSARRDTRIDGAPHDVLIWDNASVQHRASGDFAVGQPRRFWRYMVAGTAPIAYQPR